jgi:cobalt/nickel transport system permease protein
VAHYANRIVAGNSAVDSGRRVIAAGIAGYLSINAAAFATAVLFGIQPMFFTDSNGAPLYAPYPLDIAIPAMMIGHIGIAGFAELIVTAGVIGYLQKNDISLLSIVQTGIPAGTHAAVASGWQGARRMWLVIAVLFVLSPLGLIVAGTAWGEWSAEELVELDGGQTITAAPTGLLQYAAIWKSPVPDYVVPFISSEQLGYLLSGIMGVGLIILTMLISTYIAGRMTRRNDQSNP